MSNKMVFLSLIPLLFVMICSCKNDNSLIDEIPDTNGQVVELNSDMFIKYVWDYKESPEHFVFKGRKPVIVDFYTETCTPCKALRPILENWAKQYVNKVYFYSIAVDKGDNAGIYKAAAKVFGFGGYPSILMIQANGKVKGVMGFNSRTHSEIESFLNNNGVL